MDAIIDKSVRTSDKHGITQLLILHARYPSLSQGTTIVAEIQGRVSTWLSCDLTETSHGCHVT